MISMLRSLRDRRGVAAILVSLVTLVLVGGVILTTTSFGCGPAQTLGLKGVNSRCKTSPVAAVVTTPSPSPLTPPNAKVIPSPSEVPSTPDTASPTPPPFTPPPGTIPGSGPASDAYPPFVAAASGPSPQTPVLNCRLPVYVGPPGSGGFIVFPGGTFVADPKSAVTIPSPSPGSSSPAPPQIGPGPGYPGGYGLSYDHVYSRWLPVQYFNVSPDGSRYAHSSNDSVYVENVATGATTQLGVGHPWIIIGVQNQGVYATIINEAGLWLLPYSGSAKQVTTTGYWQLASAIAAYGTTTSAVPDGVANTIIRLDLSNGAVSDWFTRGGGRSDVFGFDASGNALINVSYFAPGGGIEMWVTKGPNDRTPIFGSAQGIQVNGRPVADSHGVWFPFWLNLPYQPSSPGVALYIAGSGVFWMSSLDTQLAGGCI